MNNMELREICWEKPVKDAVWKKGRINPDYSPEVLRWDEEGRIMMYSKYGRTDSIFGWTIKARNPDLDEEGVKNLDNLYPVSLFSSKKSK